MEDANVAERAAILVHIFSIQPIEHLHTVIFSDVPENGVFAVEVLKIVTTKSKKELRAI